jgi:hypothetical protein
MKRDVQKWRNLKLLAWTFKCPLTRAEAGCSILKMLKKHGFPRRAGGDQKKCPVKEKGLEVKLR